MVAFLNLKKDQHLGWTESRLCFLTILQRQQIGLVVVIFSNLRGEG